MVENAKDTPLRRKYIKFYNKFKDPSTRKIDISSDIKELNEIIQKSYKRSDINDFLVPLFVESIITAPKVIVELGVRGGESTFIFERVSKLMHSTLISVDIEDCLDVSKWDDWIFVKMDDIEFSKQFEAFCKERRIPDKIDILFIDTSHEFEHTLQEIEHWFPHLSRNAKVFFHDTNMKEIFRRKDGSLGMGWDNERGVIRALEKYFKEDFDEETEFIRMTGTWLIKHYPYCNGLTILNKIDLH